MFIEITNRWFVVFGLPILLNDIMDDDVDKRDIGEIKTSVIDDEGMFLFVLNRISYQLFSILIIYLQEIIDKICRSWRRRIGLKIQIFSIRLPLEQNKNSEKMNWVYHRDIVEDRSELKSSRKKLWCSFEFETLLILANVNDERSGGSTAIADEEGTVLLGAMESGNEYSDRTKWKEKCSIKLIYCEHSNENILESGEVDVVVNLSSIIV